MSLLDRIKFEKPKQDGLTMLIHAYEHVLFAHQYIGEEEVWTKTLKTLDKAKFDVRMDMLMRVPGMRP